MISKKTLLWSTIVVGFVAIVGAYLLNSAGTSPSVSTNTGSSENRDDGLARFTAGNVNVAIATKPGTPRVGDNALVIELADEDGNPLTNADVDAYAEMPAMGAMPAMRAPADLKQTAPGRFAGEVNLRMRGEWPLTVLITDPKGTERRLQFDLATDRAGLTIASGGSPVGGSTTAPDDASVITIDNRRRQMIGLETDVATHRDLVKTVRAVGEVTYDERLLSHITLKFDGYIGDLKANYVGANVERGQVLFTVYSPELLAAQQEYLETLKRRGNGGSQDTLLLAARQRLSLWDMTPGEIKNLERRGVPQEYLPIHAPRGGTVIERHIADGAAARQGQLLLSIADLSQVWIEADLYEADLGLVSIGTEANVSLPYLPGQRYSADVEYVYPDLQRESRTGRVRLTLDNASGDLKPGMYAEVLLQVKLGHRLSVPEEAVIVAGASRVVFVDLGEGRLKPVRIRTGRRAQGFIEVTDGLSLGDRVVTSGNFLIAAETRLKTGIDQW